MHSYHLRRALYRHRPSDPPLYELFHLRSQLGLRQDGVIDCASAQNCHSRKPGAAAAHESSTGLTEVVCHGCVGAHGLGLAEGGEVIFTTEVPEMRVHHGDVGLVEGGTNLTAVDAMADMTVDQPRFLEWLEISISSAAAQNIIGICRTWHV